MTEARAEEVEAAWKAENLGSSEEGEQVSVHRPRTVFEAVAVVQRVQERSVALEPM